MLLCNRAVIVVYPVTILFFFSSRNYVGDLEPVFFFLALGFWWCYDNVNEERKYVCFIIVYLAT